ncbi:glycosyltransferase [Alteromonas mediterranea]|uniref:glycosyltransferase n=1 Tax=Alteromonas mediterranea TaxID=314275 RepID=UPI0032B30E7D
MKILYHHRIASKDGQYVHVEELTNALDELGHELHFVAPQVNENADFGGDGGFVSKLKKALPKALYETLELSYSAWVFIKLVVAILKFKPEVIYERYNLYQPAGVIAAKLFKIPLLLEINAPLVEERAKYSGLALQGFAKKIEDFTWRGATHCLPVTDVLADYMREANIPESRITVIHNGVRQQFIDEMMQHDINVNKQEIVIGFTGFIHPWHGMDKALEAIAEHKELPLRLICVGDGNILPDLRQQAETLGISEKVEFKGLVTRDKVLDFVKEFDIALQPDVTAYASPLKMFEYMAVGALIVAPKTPNIQEILSDNTALFFEKGDKADFKKALTNAITSYKVLDCKRRAVKQSILDKQFVWQENARKVVELAEALVGSKY